LLSAIRSRLSRLLRGGASPDPGEAPGPPARLREARPLGPQRPDILVFPVIDWVYRRQRPQHLATQLAKLGYRVFYFSTEFVEETFDFKPEEEEVARGVFYLKLPGGYTPPDIYADRPSELEAEVMRTAIARLRREYGIGACINLVQYPFWEEIATSLPNSWTVYDCMDAYHAFPNASGHLREMEEALVAKADRVICSSDYLGARFRGLGATVEVIHNAASPDDYAGARGKSPRGERKVAGYIGCLTEWVDTALLAEAARRLPEVDFVIVGEPEVDVGDLEALPNVTLTGEVPYGDLPGHMARFDVGLLAYGMNDVNVASDPVKIYEYLAAGKPVVATRTPEIERLGELVELSDDAEGFVANIGRALAEDDAKRRAARIEFAERNRWQDRALAYREAFRRMIPKVGIVVPAYNQRRFTVNCLIALERFTAYPDWEVVVVNDASTDETREWLDEWAAERPWIRPVHREANGGFAVASNHGAREADGDYLVFLNNDTYVTEGWLGNLLWHFRDEPELGMLGPVSNHGGNECVIPISYDSMAEMARLAGRRYLVHRHERRPMGSVHFFCAVIPRRVWEQLGPMDEGFEIAFFEDDDYSRRILEAGYQLACAEDVFVHHHLSATVDSLGKQRREELFKRNLARFEEKWGKWSPHRFRDEVYETLGREPPPAE